jgi:hypothetical protein
MYLLSDPKYLRIIKRNQYRHQIPALALLVIAFLLNFAFSTYLRYPAMALAFTAMIWYMYVGACFRFKQRIPAYEEENLLSPLSGRVRLLKTSSDISYLKISKHALDTVEIRSPHSSSVWEGDTLTVNYQRHNLIFRFEGKELIRFEDASMDAGSLIGMLIGNGSVSISLPRPLVSDLKPKEICEAGLTCLLV